MAFETYLAGVPITINSDDPPLFNTTFNDEVALLGPVFGLSRQAIDEVLLNGVRYSFLPPERKQEIEAAFRVDLDRLKVLPT
jgi:adenosine deaminase